MGSRLHGRRRGAMVVLVKLLLVLLQGTALQAASCNCEAACAQLVADQRQEIAKLEAKVRELRASCLPVAAAARRISLSEAPDACGGDWTLASDADAEALRGCKAVGHLVVGRSVTSLSALWSLETAENIIIYDNDLLDSLTGLENLVRVNNELDIRRNSKLTSMLGLESLRVSRNVTIRKNDRLESLIGLENLTFVEDTLHIERNPQLSSLSGLQALRTAHKVWIYKNDRLESLSGLENLASVGYELDIDGNPELSSLWGLQGLRAAERIFVYNNDKLATLTGLEGLVSGGGELGTLEIDIDGNPALSSLSALQGLRTAHGVYIYRNERLSSLAGLESLTRVEFLYIQGNGKLSSLAGLVGLQAAFGLIIQNNDKLESLLGLENLVNMSDLGIYRNQNLLSLSGLQGVQTARVILIHENAKLASLEGLENLEHAADEIDLDNNPSLTSLSGLHNLRSVKLMYVWQCPKLTSLKGLSNLTNVEDLKIGHNRVLPSLEGLEGITNLPTRLALWENPKITSLRGLESLRTAGWVRILANEGLTSLAGLHNLESVLHEFEVDEGDALRSLNGLEGLKVVGSLRLARLWRLRSLDALRNLTHVWGGVFIGRTRVSSLEGLGSLRTAGHLVVQSADRRMSILGGPFAAGASVNVVNIDETSWPKCITPHERMALVSAVANIDASSIPDATWEWWREHCQRQMVEPLACTKGHPCTFALAGEVHIFISGRTSGCGFCSEDQLQVDATSGVVDLGYALKDEESGLRSICRCGTENGPVTQLLLRGPRQSGLTVCSRGHSCLLRLDGELERADRVVIMSNCSRGNPLLGFAASWTAENAWLLHDAAWQAAPPTRYQVCWRAPCTSTADGPTCPAPEDSYFQIGELDLLGPYPRDYMLVLGDYLSVANIGMGVSDGDQMRLRRICGKESEEITNALAVNSSGKLFDFGRLSDGRTEAGSHHLCWCQPRDGVRCDAESHFMTESGSVQILCPSGQELSSSRRCQSCPPGRQRLEPGLGPCLACVAGQFSQGGQRCEACPQDTFAGLTGSSACVACQPWESADDQAIECRANPEKVIMLVSFFLSVGALCALLVRTIRRHLRVLDVSLDQCRTIITTFGSHGLSNFGRSSFPVTLYRTGHSGLDSPLAPLRVRVKDAVRLELLTQHGESINARLDTSMGTLVVDFPHDLYHQQLPVPFMFSLPVLSILVVVLGGLVLERGMATEAFVGATATSLLCTALSIAARAWKQATPLAQRLSAFKQELTRLYGRTESCKKGPNRAIAIGKLHNVLDFFSDFIQDRAAYYLTSNILIPITSARKLSYAELVGAGEVEWFVSHFWGTAFAHFCTALRKHAETVCSDGRSWTMLRYWICFCSNNQHHIEEELGAGWQESSFYITLKSGHCQGTCMVLDDQALPLTRIWCIFELLQTVKLERNSANFQGLLLCTSGGVLNAGSGSVEVAMALAQKVADMDLEEAQATNPNDAEMIRQQVIAEMETFGALNAFVCQEVRKVLVTAQRNSSQQFAAVLAHLDDGIANNAARFANV